MIRHGVFYWWLYRCAMKFAHRYNWHYAPMIHLANGDCQRWCHWCGFRESYRVYKKKGVHK